MALATYTDLLASIAGWMNRTDLTAVIPDFVTLAEARISRDLRLRKQIVTSTLTTASGTRGVSLPTDWLQFENVSVLSSPEAQLTYAPVEHLDTVYPNNGTSGKPSLYTIEGDQILFGPTPDAAYTVSILYYARFAALQTASTNWLLTNHPSVYLYACLLQACLYVRDKSGAADYQGLYNDVMNSLQSQDDSAQHSGSSLRVRRV
jgi:hypothetical protein